jgi:hypothetical protein
VLGIGGGGDVVGSLSLARRCEELGTPFVLGGVAWERMPIDPHPGPRPAEQIVGGRRLGERAVLAGPDTSTPEGVRFSEAHVAAHLGAETVLIDVSRGTMGAAEGIRATASELDCELAVYVDVGGDALAVGDEPGLASPLCDAVMLAAGLSLADELPGVLTVLGPGCDGELTPEQVLDRVAALARTGSWLGTWSLTPQLADEVEAAARLSGTEASMQVVRCARGETGEAAIRGGRRHVFLGPTGALAFLFDLEAAAPELALARAVMESADIEVARATLDELGVRSELDYERSKTGEGP